MKPGEHFTPREIIRLMVDLMLVTEDEELSKENIIKSIYDPCCGTGGMLTIAKERIWRRMRLQTYTCSARVQPEDLRCHEVGHAHTESRWG